MREKILLFSAVLCFLFLFDIAYGQIELLPGEIEFELLPGEVEFILLPGTTEFTTEAIGIKFLRLYGYLDYLNIHWNSYYLSGIEADVGVKCYLNCTHPETDCAGEAGWQSCGYEGPPGERICTIVDPSYNFTAENNVTCKFYDPDFPEIEYVDPETGGYPSLTFKAIDFNIQVLPATVTVGERFRLQIIAKNLALLASDYTVKISTPSPSYVVIDRNLLATDELSTNETEAVYSGITLLSSVKDVVFNILAKSNIDPTICTEAVDCKYLGKCGDESPRCLDGKCAKACQIRISSGNKSLPEFGWLGLLQIMLIAVAVLVAAFRFYTEKYT